MEGSGAYKREEGGGIAATGRRSSNRPLAVQTPLVQCAVIGVRKRDGGTSVHRHHATACHRHTRHHGELMQRHADRGAGRASPWQPPSPPRTPYLPLSVRQNISNPRMSGHLVQNT